jgi:hypothetical protein
LKITSILSMQTCYCVMLDFFFLMPFQALKSPIEWVRILWQVCPNFSNLHNFWKHIFFAMPTHYLMRSFQCSTYHMILTCLTLKLHFKNWDSKSSLHKVVIFLEMLRTFLLTFTQSWTCFTFFASCNAMDSLWTLVVL